MAMIREAIITTLAADGGAHITPLGYREQDERVVLAPFVPIGLPILTSGLAIFVGLRPPGSSGDTATVEAAK